MKRALILIFVAGCGSSPPAAPVQQGFTNEDCVALADAQVEGWRSDGLGGDALEQRYQAALAGCAGPDVDPTLATLVGKINFDYTQLARQVLTEKLGASAYVSLVRDRSRKRRLGANDAVWLAAWARGDEDGDYVPDDRDRCPGTPPFTVTGDDGCPSTAPPPARMNGNAEDLRAYFQKVGVVAGLGCQGAATPETPQPLRAGRSAAGHTLVSVTRVGNQPDGCPVMIEVEGVYHGYWDTGPARSPTDVIYAYIFNTPLHLTLRSGDARDPAAAEQVFAARTGDTDFLATAQVPTGRYSLSWRARAMNGNGIASSWSALRNTHDFSLTE